jgi:hypothetical protein
MTEPDLAHRPAVAIRVSLEPDFLVVDEKGGDISPPSSPRAVNGEGRTGQREEGGCIAAIGAELVLTGKARVRRWRPAISVPPLAVELHASEDLFGVDRLGIDVQSRDAGAGFAEGVVGELGELSAASRVAYMRTARGSRGASGTCSREQGNRLALRKGPAWGQLILIRALRRLR